MDFGKAIGVACSTFAITNIDDMFVLVTFFAEGTTSTAMTPLKIAIGQYIGFSIIVMVSMIGFALALAVPTEPIGFLGLLPLLIGVWKAINLLIPVQDVDTDDDKIAGMKSIFKVAAITIMNGGDNIGTYTPLFAQAKKAEVAVYIVVYYIMLGIWCLVAYLIMGQRHLLLLIQKHVDWLMPLLYIGLGIFIIVSSECYPWSIEKIDENIPTHPGKLLMSVVTAFTVLLCSGFFILLQIRKKKAERSFENTGFAEEVTTPVAEEVNIQGENADGCSQISRHSASYDVTRNQSETKIAHNLVHKGVSSTREEDPRCASMK